MLEAFQALYRTFGHKDSYSSCASCYTAPKGPFMKEDHLYKVFPIAAVKMESSNTYFPTFREILHSLINPSFYSLTLVTAHTRTLQSYKRHIPKGYRFSFFPCQTALEERLDFILRKIDSKVPFFDQILSCNFYLPWKSFI